MHSYFYVWVHTDSGVRKDIWMGIYREYEREFKITVFSKSGIRLAKSPLFSGKWVKLNAMDLSRKYSTAFKYYF